VRTGAFFLNSMEQLARRRLVSAALVIGGLFLAFFALLCHLMASNAGNGLSSPDAALGALFLTLPSAAYLCAAFQFILGSSLLPGEISAGRAGFWAALPVSRLSVFAGFSLSCLACASGVSALLFGGIEAVTGAFFRNSPTDLPLAILAFMAWSCVLWAVVTLLSMSMNRIVAIIICFCGYGLMNFIGGLAQIAGAMPQGGPGPAFRIAGLVSGLIFPSDPPFRAMMYGLMPAGSSMEQFLAFTGAAVRPPVLLTLYSLAWSAAVIWLAWRRFSRQDLK